MQETASWTLWEHCSKAKQATQKPGAEENSQPQPPLDSPPLSTANPTNTLKKIQLSPTTAPLQICLPILRVGTGEKEREGAVHHSKINRDHLLFSSLKK